MPWSGFRRKFPLRRLFTVYVLAGSLLIFLAIGFFTIRLAAEVEEQAELTTWLLSRFASTNISQGPPGALEDLVLRLDEIAVPFIVTDNRGRPILWNEPVVGIPMPEHMLDLLVIDPAGGNEPHYDRVLELVREYDGENEPFAIIGPVGERLGTLHYGYSSLTRKVRWLPWAEMVILAGFFLVVVWGLGVKRQGDAQRLFAGMAKETAHQLGTPITSIMGWLEILRDRQPQKDVVIEELGADVRRLGKVSERFSQIGSTPLLEDDDIGAVREATLAYFKRRLPHIAGGVELRAEGAVRHRCRFNRDLMEWVLENLVKNGIDALKGRPGTITVGLADGPGGSVQITVSDTGGGVPSRIRNRIFEPGFTTKRRGWGMGLALVKRIIVQYHGGRINVADTGPKGTTFLISLPGEE